MRNISAKLLRVLSEKSGPHWEQFQFAYQCRCENYRCDEPEPGIEDDRAEGIPGRFILPAEWSAPSSAAEERPTIFPFDSAFYLKSIDSRKGDKNGLRAGHGTDDEVPLPGNVRKARTASNI